MVIMAVLTLPAERPDKLEIPSFATTESAELYFKNVRSFYYNTSEEAEGILYVYRLKSIFTDSSQSLPFALYNNWRTNETFIRLDTSHFDTKLLVGLVADSAGFAKDTLVFPTASNETQYAFARDVFRAIQHKKKLIIITEEGTIPISESQTSSIRTTLKDYFKLLGKI